MICVYSVLIVILIAEKYGWKEGILESKRVARTHVGAPVYLTEKGGWVDAGLGKVGR